MQSFDLFLNQYFKQKNDPSRHCANMQIDVWDGAGS